MSTSIHLHTLEHLKLKDSSARLNLFSGRAMSESAFDKSQNYVADRIAPLLSGVWPGIQKGLEVEFLSIQKQQGELSSSPFKVNALTKMAFESYSPTYPIEHTSSGHSPFKEYNSSETMESVDEAVELSAIEPLFRVQAGSAVTAAGTVVKLFTPLEVKWSDLLARSNLVSDNNLSGLFMLCLGRDTIPVNYDEKSACRRYEVDPIQDSRFETIGFLNLIEVEKQAFFYKPVELIERNRHSVINRFLSQLVIEPNKIKLPQELTTLGILAIDQQKPLWFEMLGARFLSQSLSFPMALLAHTEQVFKELVAEDNRLGLKITPRILSDINDNARLSSADFTTPSITRAFLTDQPALRTDRVSATAFNFREDLQALFSNVSNRSSLASRIKGTFQFLPAAGSLPSSLLKNVANINAPLPEFAINYPGLRVDMMPVPVTGMAAVLRRELGRGVIKFDSATTERIRLLIAVPDHEYDPKLLDVPISDKQLSVQLYDYGMQAYDAWLNWRNQLAVLYGNKPTLEQQKLLGVPNLDSVEYNAPIAPSNPDLVGKTQPLNSSDYDDNYFFDGLIRQQGDGIKVTSLAPPYREGVPTDLAYMQWLGDGGDLPQLVGIDQAGLVIAKAEIEEDIADRNDELQKNYDFVEKINDLILLQRQQLDVQSVSFAAFAGGVAGDGSGLQLTRWLPHVAFTPENIAADSEDEDAAVDDVSVASDNNTTEGFTALRTNNTMLYNAATLYTPPPQVTTNLIGTSYPESPVVSFPTSNNAYIQQAVDNISKSNYEMVEKLNTGVNKLAQLSINNRTITGDTFSKPSLNFGTLKHVSAIAAESRNSRDAVEDLQLEIDKLLIEVDAFVSSLPDEIVEQLAEHIQLGIKDNTPPFKTMVEDLRLAAELPSVSSLYKNETESDSVKVYRSDADLYDVLFKVGRSLVKEISAIEGARIDLIKLQKILQDYILEKQKALSVIETDIVAARKNLISLDALRREALDDYTAVQRLVIEHWQEVEEKFNHRNQVLNGMLGLYYVKVRETATSVVLPNIQKFEYAEEGDLVPGCRGDEQVNLPEELDVFVEAVLDIPVSHWQSLSTRIHQLPGRQRVMSMLERRQPRIQSKQQMLSRRTHSSVAGLSVLRHQTLFVLNSFAERQYSTVHSLKHLQQEAANVLSLEDVLNNSSVGRLSKPAQLLRNNIELACYCLLEKLHELLPSIRLTWGQLAEDDQLAIDYPEKWPLIDQAEQTSYNALRTSLELVRWLNRQLTQQADGDSRTALRNLIRACLMLSASDDPGDLLEGQLQVAPNSLQLGSILRLSLNQEAVPGAILQLLDNNKRTVAKLRLDDQDNTGASATIVKLFDTNSQVNTQQFMVIGHKYKDV